MTKRIFQECMAMMGLAFGEEPDRNKIRLYWEYLKDFSDTEIKFATDKIIRNNRWFPKIAEIRDVVKGYREQRHHELEAQRMQKALPAPDDRIPLAELKKLAGDLVKKLMPSQKPELKVVKPRRKKRPAPMNPQTFRERKAELEQQKQAILEG